MSAHAAPARFEIDEYRVEGNSVLDEASIDDALYPFVGPDRTALDVEKARRALSALYAARGYSTVFAQVPRQKVVDGVIVLQVVERRIGRLRITGSRYFSLDAIRAAAPSMAEGQVPNMNDFRRDIVALNRWPDRTITPVLKAGGSADTVDLELKVKDSAPLHASIEASDRQSYHTTRTRLQGTVTYDNLWQRGDVVSASFQVAPERVKDSSLFIGSYQYRIPDSDRSLTLSYLHSGSHIATAGGSSVVGRGYDVGLTYQIPLKASGSFSDTLSAGIDFKRFAQITPGDTASNNTPVTWVPVNLAYTAVWTGHDVTTVLSPSVAAGLAALSDNAKAFGVGRNGATANYTYLRLDASQLRPAFWGTQLYLHAAAQETPQPLLSNEQFGIGGADSVRGYYESEALGDYGVFSQIEWRGLELSVPKWGITQYRVYAFYDAGEVWYRDALSSERATTGLAAAGVGVRGRLLKNISAEAAESQILVSGPYSRAGSRRFLFHLVGGF